MYLPLSIRIWRARRNAIRLQTQRGGVDMTYPIIPVELILSQLGPKVVVDCSEGFIVTEAGFITMALFPRDARYCQGMLMTPGVDDRNQFGYLVVREGNVPFHSLAPSIGQAAEDARRAWEKSSKLVQHFGDKSKLKNAAITAPWYLLSGVEDAAAAGLCKWGIDSFLRRLCLRHICKWIGLPQFVIRLAGVYGLRVTAATLLRYEHKLSKVSLIQENEK